ncbi:MAG: ferrous iron transport protein B [Xylanivirga thermophila]|jgi:ferrous iron transport protein B|uniref:ferrous iron transport protein B n=1 Tax=Xylanivirga thermophila TaxID=2496273 RepID=UPI0039F49E78
MGLTNKSTGIGLLIDETNKNDFTTWEGTIVALAGNPNTGKSTVFNSLTGLKQHTGNWPGKTVSNAKGEYEYNGEKFLLVDLPGTYSLSANSVEEEVARDFICFENPKATIVVADATCLERNLNLVLQITEITNNVILCVNLMDEARRKKIDIDIEMLSNILGIPVVGTSARDGIGLDKLMDKVQKVSNGSIRPRPYRIDYPKEIEDAISLIESSIPTSITDKINARWFALRLIEDSHNFMPHFIQYMDISKDKMKIIEEKVEMVWDDLAKFNLTPNNIRDEIVGSIVMVAEETANQVVSIKDEGHKDIDKKIDDILTSKKFGIPIMIGMLAIIFWITIEGANYPSEMLAKLLFGIEDKLSTFFINIGSPKWLHDIIVLGMYRTLAWVISVMLPPMAIFFPLFTFLEDLGYLPRIAFNLDNFFKKACAHGKQALTMCMGFGCNAAGIVACRIIDSPRERLIATITNNFVPCNGRFPILIAMSSIFIGGMAASRAMSSLIATITIMCIIILGVIITLLISKILSKTILKGLPSSFTLELPPYRKPQIGRILVRSILDRTLFVLGRAVAVAAPAGIIIWIMANVNIGNANILDHCANFLNPLGHLMGMDGYILMAFILGLPANEIVIPIIIMSYMSSGYMMELESLDALRNLLVANGWTWLTAVCVMLFSLMHFPCGTTLWTIKKETGSRKWTFVSFLVPTVTGMAICIVVAQLFRLLGIA